MSGALKVKTTGAKFMVVYSIHSATWAAPEPTAQKETAKRYGNVQSLLEAFRPNGLYRRVSGLSQVARRSDGNVRVAAVQAAQRGVLSEAPGKEIKAGRFHF